VTGPAPRTAVKVIIGGEEFTVRSELPPEYTKQVASYFDRALAGIRGSAPTMEIHKIAILAGLAMTDELFQARRGDAELTGRLTALVDEITRVLPPGKRGGAASGGDS
jgi:cell division protein ZapA (FtsZ GTPase activity inhibitor)